jgi:hypothetical protein
VGSAEEYPFGAVTKYHVHSILLKAIGIHGLNSHQGFKCLSFIISSKDWLGSLV